MKKLLKKVYSKNWMFVLFLIILYTTSIEIVYLVSNDFWLSVSIGISIGLILCSTFFLVVI